MERDLRVLVVDDHRSTRDGMRQLLEMDGYLAASAENGFVALRRLDEESFDVVVTDFSMPGMDGLSLLREIRRKHAGVEVILWSGSWSEDLERDAVESGVCACFAKPLSIDLLEAAIDRAGSANGACLGIAV